MWFTTLYTWDLFNIVHQLYLKQTNKSNPVWWRVKKVRNKNNKGLWNHSDLNLNPDLTASCIKDLGSLLIFPKSPFLLLDKDSNICWIVPSMWGSQQVSCMKKVLSIWPNEYLVTHNFYNLHYLLFCTLLYNELKVHNVQMDSCTHF